MKNTNENKNYIYVLRAFSMLAVIFLHSSSNILRVEKITFGWHIANIITSYITIGVLIFFMISGALLLQSNKTDDISYLWKKRLPKLFIPLVMWSLVSILKDYWFKRDIEAMNQALISFLYKPAAVHFWFMYTIIPIYIISPVIKRCFDALDKRLIKYCMTIWILISFFFSIRNFVYKDYVNLFNPTFLNNIDIMQGYIGFFAAGYIIDKYSIKLKTYNIIIIIILSVTLSAYLTYDKTLYYGFYFEQLKSYKNILPMINACMSFELARRANFKGLILKISKFLSSLSFGVYLCHNIILSLLLNLGFKIYSISSVIICFAVVTALSITLCVILSSIKPLCFIFTGMNYKSACEVCNIKFIVKK